MANVEKLSEHRKAKDLGKVYIYKLGLVHASACVENTLTREKIEDGANLQAPTGISSGWHISENPTFSGGQPNPSPCDRYKDRMHYLLNC